MAALPLAPQMARAIVAAGPLGCAEEVITIVSLLGVASLWVGASDRRRALEEAKLRYVPTFHCEILSYSRCWAWPAVGGRLRPAARPQGSLAAASTKCLRLINIK